MRKAILIVLGIALLAGSFLIAKNLINKKNKPKPKFDKIVNTVYTETVNNKTIPVLINASGNVIAKNKIDLYAEVQGVLKTTSKDFKAGTEYNRGQTIVRINSDEFYANLQSQKSNFYNAVTSIMPDIRMDFPDEYLKWQSFLNNFDINKTTPKLPELTSDKEKFFVSGRGIFTSYYNVKNLEVKLGKYNLRAPFNGILTETMVSSGTLVRVGQKLGEFIDPSIYEMEISINEAHAHLLQKGKTVMVSNLENNKNWKAKVVRVNSKVDQTTQSVNVYLEVKGDGLRDGMYLNASLEAKSIENAIEIPRTLLVNNTDVFVVNDTILELKTINPVYFNDENAIIKGLEDGTKLLAKTLPGAYNGMLVKTLNDNK